jgi:hypothetical protein
VRCCCTDAEPLLTELNAVSCLFAISACISKSPSHSIIDPCTIQKQEPVAADSNMNSPTVERLSELSEASDSSIRPEAPRDSQLLHTQRSCSGSYSAASTAAPAAAGAATVDTLAFAAAAAARHTFASTYPARTVQAPPLTVSSCETLVRTFDSSDQVRQYSKTYTHSFAQCDTKHFMQSGLQV